MFVEVILNINNLLLKYIFLISIISCNLIVLIKFESNIYIYIYIN